MPEGFDGVELGGGFGGVEAEDDADGVTGQPWIPIEPEAAEPYARPKMDLIASTMTPVTCCL